MPYTPPTQRSPATSKPNSPILSRNHSYSEQSSAPSTHIARPAAPPRSVSSTSYLNKHRRSPSITNHHSANGHVVSSHGKSHTGFRHSRGSSTSGAVATPPDSSDDDDERRRVIGDIKELHEALKNIDVKRGSSPNSEETADGQDQFTASVRPGGLTPEARKISHSRSASEITLSQHAPQIDTAPVISSTEGSDAEDDELRIKPPLLRKKSGELVKPALRGSARRRPSSMPGTPTYAKAVHFNENMEQVRHFFQVERPMAVSAGSSPVETYDDDAEYPFGYDDGYRTNAVEWEIKLSNFPKETFERKTAPVRIERIFLASDHKTLVGTVAVANIAFQKLVVARFTLDYWKTTSEVVAEYNHDVRKKQSNDGYDRFNFNIKLADQANLDSKTLLLCVRYNVNGQEFWDNNDAMNYQVDFIKKVKQKSKTGSSPLAAIPRSRHSPSAPRPRSMPVGSFDEDFGHGLDSRFQYSSSSQGFLGDSLNPTIRLKPKSKRGSLFPDQKTANNSSGLAFSTRYDFGASLTAALSNAQNATGKPIPRKGQHINTGKPVASASSSAAAPVPGTRPTTLSSEKPDLQSAEYNELIQKFCFFGTPAKGSPTVRSPGAKTSVADGATDYLQNSPSSGSSQPSASNSPPSPAMAQLVDGASDARPTVNETQYLSRSSSPGPVTGSRAENRMSSAFSYGYSMHGNMFPERAHTPQACM